MENFLDSQEVTKPGHEHENMNSHYRNNWLNYRNKVLDEKL